MGKPKLAGAVALAALLCTAAPLATAGEKSSKASASEREAARPALPPQMVALEKSLHKQTGDVRIPEAKAVLHLGQRYYMLPANEARRVLTEVWGNPPASVANVLGMVIERDRTIFDTVWGAIITYEDTGHVSDADAHEQDYAKVLREMQQGQEAANPERVKAGYPEMQLVGWAQPPSYDASSHALVWARELKTKGDPENGLNYDVRLLGRTGVLSLNMLASMKALDEVRSAAQSFGKAASFEPGAAYTDFDAKTDKAAEYGLAGLVAGGAAVAVAQKVGLLAIFLKFGKLILLGLAAFGAGIWGFIRKLAGRKAEDEVY